MKVETDQSITLRKKKNGLVSEEISENKRQLTGVLGKLQVLPWTITDDIQPAKIRFMTHLTYYIGWSSELKVKLSCLQ